MIMSWGRTGDLPASSDATAVACREERPLPERNNSCMLRMKILVNVVLIAYMVELDMLLSL